MGLTFFVNSLDVFRLSSPSLTPPVNHVQDGTYCPGHRGCHDSYFRLTSRSDDLGGRKSGGVTGERVTRGDRFESGRDPPRGRRRTRVHVQGEKRVDPRTTVTWYLNLWWDVYWTGVRYFKGKAEDVPWPGITVDCQRDECPRR